MSRCYPGPSHVLERPLNADDFSLSRRQNPQTISNKSSTHINTMPPNAHSLIITMCRPKYDTYYENLREILASAART